jgi:formylglycine-generating enzyme required for sulfatase activity
VYKPLVATGQQPVVDYLTTDDLVSEFDRVLLFGGPGAGKSTTARAMAAMLAQSCLADEGPAAHGHRGLLPLFVSVRGFTTWERFVAPTPGPRWRVLTNYLEDLEFRAAGLSTGELTALMRDGQVLVIVDGIDEAWISPDDTTPGGNRMSRLLDILGSLFSTFPVKALLTARPEVEGAVWRRLAGIGFCESGLAPLTADFAEVVADRFLRLSGSGDQATRRLRFREILSKDDCKVLAAPLYVALYAAAIGGSPQSSYPPSRATLVGRALELIALRWTQVRSALDEPEARAPLDSGSNRAHLLSALQRIAMRCVAQDDDDDRIGGGGVDVGHIFRELAVFKAAMYDAFTYLVTESGLLEDLGGDRYTFGLRPFEEYLAAAELARSGDFSHWLPSMAADPVRWLQPVSIAGELMAHAHGAPAAAAAIGDVLLDASQDPERRPWSFLILSSAVLDSLITDSSLPASAGTCRRYVRRLAAGFPEQDDQVPARGAVHVAAFLARLGDSRRGVSIDERGRPAIEWCAMPAGEFVMGSGDRTTALLTSAEWAGEWAADHEKPAHTVHIDAFEISRYPVTVAQFRVFADAPDGYADQRWWDGLAVPRTHQQFVVRAGARATDPVSGVSWFDSVAFCRWLSDLLGETITLPTEPQWEYSARGTDDRIFPWGDGYRAANCNSIDSGIGEPSPVGLYPFSDGPWGSRTPMDLAGNVWEWCSTAHSAENGRVFSYPYVADDRENMVLDDSYRRVVRGGSFTNVPFFLRCSMRGYDRPSFRPVRQGFRIVRLGH